MFSLSGSTSSFGLNFWLWFFKKYLFIYLLFGVEGREKEKERNITVWLPLHTHPTGNLAHNPGMCPDWESNQPLFGSQPALNPLSYISRGSVHFIFFRTLSQAKSSSWLVYHPSALSTVSAP